MKTISERLKYLIDGNGITPYYVSKEIDVSESTLSRLLSNTSAKPSMKTLKSLASYFSVNPEWLLTGNGEMLKNTQPQQNTEIQSLNQEIEELKNMIREQSKLIIDIQSTLNTLKK